MDLSKHAQKRCRQRGIPEKKLEIILKYGTPSHRRDGALKVMITKSDKQNMIADLKKRIQELEKLAGRAVILSTDGKIITTY